MRSAYLVLGVPGNATPEEIEAAFRKAEGQFPRERLAEEQGALARFGEIKTAYQVLRDPQARMAHDRKLQGSARPAPQTVIVESDDSSALRRALVMGALLVAAGIAAASYSNWRTVQARKEQAALELETRKTAAAAAERVRQDEERQAAFRAEQAKQAENNERQLVLESKYSAMRADSVQRAQESIAISARRQESAEQQRRESARLDEERRATQEARMRVERDKQRLRELCYQNYRQSNC